MRALVIVAVLVGCHSSQPPPPSSSPGSGATGIKSEDVTFDDGVPGTVVRPAAAGTYPGVVLMAGSGPTDRDWNSPMLPGKNGSGKLLAEALARHGIIVLRFDKAGTGGNKHAITGNVTFDIYRDEGRAALAELRTLPGVDAKRLYVAGHSEGALHAARVAVAEGHSIAGLLLLSGTARTLEVILLAQIEHQLRMGMPAQADATVAALKQAFDDFSAGKPVDPTKVTPIKNLQVLVNSVTRPETAALSRGLFGFDPLPELSTIDVPVFVFNGAKDMQVDPVLDAKVLADTRKAANKDVTLFIAPDANHVLEHEPRPLAEINPGNVNYNADDRVIDDAALTALVDWLAKH
jgi:pimeloyl-ACP methyl ester carboxylesterase